MVACIGLVVDKYVDSFFIFELAAAVQRYVIHNKRYKKFRFFMFISAL